MSHDNAPDDAQRPRPAAAAGPQSAFRHGVPLDPELAVRQPVDLALVDVREAEHELLLPAVLFAAEVMDIEPFKVWRLATGAAKLLVADRARGLQLKELCEVASVARGHLDDSFDLRLVCAVDLAVRVITVRAGRRITYEELFVTPVSANKDSVALGVDRFPQASSSLRLVGLAAGSSDRHVALSDLALTTGTKDDHSSPRADDDRIAAFAAELGVRPCGPLDEHADFLLTLERDVELAVRDAADARPSLFRKLLGMDPATFIDRAFTPLLLAGPLAVGPPQRRRSLSENNIAPGDDDALIAVLTRAGRRGVAWSDLPVPADLAAAGFARIYPPESAVHTALGISPRGAWGTEWWWHAESRHLVRKLPHGRSASIQRWRVFGLDRFLGAAAALVERHQEPLPTVCLQTAAAQTAPGTIPARTVRQQACTRAVLRLARAAVVAADRARRGREARGLDQPGPAASR